jgi:hypothetical protein
MPVVDATAAAAAAAGGVIPHPDEYFGMFHRRSNRPRRIFEHLQSAA